MRRRRDLVEPQPEPGLTAAQAITVLAQLLFTADTPQASDYYAAVNAVTGATPEERLERVWHVVDAFGLRAYAERQLVQEWTRRLSGRHDERTSA